MNELFGEKWYELILNCEEPAALKLPVMKTELGKWSEYGIILENPSDKEVHAVSRSTNSFNFEVVPNEIILKPFS